VDAQVPLAKRDISRVILQEEHVVLQQYVDLVVMDLTVDTESEVLGQNWLQINTVQNNLIHVLPHNLNQPQSAVVSVDFIK
jgi:hypothetical protein